MTPSDAVASLRPRPFGPPLRGRAPQSDGIISRRLVGRQNTKQGTAGSTLNSPIRGLRLGVGVNVPVGHVVMLCAKSDRRWCILTDR